MTSTVRTPVPAQTPRTGRSGQASNKRLHTQSPEPEGMVDLDSENEANTAGRQPRTMLIPDNCFVQVLPNDMKDQYCAFLSWVNNRGYLTEQTTVNTNTDYPTAGPSVSNTHNSRPVPSVHLDTSDQNLQDIVYADEVGKFLTDYKAVKDKLFANLNSCNKNDLVKNTNSPDDYNLFREIRRDLTHLYSDGQNACLKLDTKEKAINHTYVHTNTQFNTHILYEAELIQLQDMTKEASRKQNNIVRNKVLDSMMKNLEKVNEHMNDSGKNILVAKAFRAVFKSNPDICDQRILHKKYPQGNTYQKRNTYRKESTSNPPREQVPPTNKQQNWPNKRTYQDQGIPNKQPNNYNTHQQQQYPDQGRNQHYDEQRPYDSYPEQGHSYHQQRNTNYKGNNYDPNYHNRQYNNSNHHSRYSTRNSEVEPNDFPDEVFQQDNYRTSRGEEPQEGNSRQQRFSNKRGGRGRFKGAYTERYAWF